MLRISITKNANNTSLRLEGRLTGPWVGELERAWRAVAAESTNGRASVDLTDVTFVGEDGKRLLETLYGEGAKLKAASCATRRLVDEIEHGLHGRQPRSLAAKSD